MEPSPIPPNETARLAALRELLILDTPPEQRFDRIVEFAANEFEVPTAMVSLVDANRLWFKSKIGLEACEAPRDHAFCAHALLSAEPLLIPDTLEDPRFRDNPNVVGGPHVRFYAGAPLVLPSGLIAGTLCLIDTQPHALDPTDLAILGTLRDLVVTELLERGDA